jgi:5-methylthioadenosine/S-adenosylhomocysteine deaminase
MAALVVHNGVVVPIDPPQVVHDPGWVRVQDSRIAAIGSGAPELRADDRAVDAHGGLILPGFISAHQHVLDILLRGGLVVGPTFLDWLLGLYYAGMANLRPEDAEIATRLGATETIRAGVTCVVDNWGVCNGDSTQHIADCADASLSAYDRSGLRVIFARMFATRVPEPWRAIRTTYDLDRLIAPLDATLASVETLRRETARRPGSARMQVCASPELPEMVEPHVLSQLLERARHTDTIVPTHLLASPESRDYADARRLADLDGLGPELLGAHCTAATDADLRVLAHHDVGVAHCPTASAALGTPVSAGRMRAAGLTVGLGSDNASLNRNSDILAEARRAVSASRTLDDPRSWISAPDAVRMATIDGAHAIGLGDTIGSLEPGKQADIIVIDTAAAHWWPRHDWLDTLVMQGKSTDVQTVVVDGQIIMQDRAITWLDHEAENRLHHDAQLASNALRERAGLR